MANRKSLRASVTSAVLIAPASEVVASATEPALATKSSWTRLRLSIGCPLRPKATVYSSDLADQRLVRGEGRKPHRTGGRDRLELLLRRQSKKLVLKIVSAGYEYEELELQLY